MVLLPVALAATPLAAQLTPEQRAARQQAPSAANSVRIADPWMESAFDGEPAWRFRADHRLTGGARRDRSVAEQIRELHSRGRATGGAVPQGHVATASELHDHWFTIGQRTGTPRPLRRAPVGQVDVRAEIPLALTLASPIGSTGRPLMIRTAVGTATPGDLWSRMGEVTPDEHGNYRVEVPALHAGTYELQIEVYDPDVPEVPYSTSRSTLIAWVP